MGADSPVFSVGTGFPVGARSFPPFGAISIKKVIKLVHNLRR